MTAIARSLRTAVSTRARNWARRRQGTDPASTVLRARRIYILPTRAGLIFAVIILTMLIGAMNYSNNMGFALTFLLAGVGIISIYHCHRNLAETRIHYLGARPVFAGERMRFSLALENCSRMIRWQLCVDREHESDVIDELQSGARHTLTVRVPTIRRGFVRLPRLKVSTRYPLGLFQAWAWVNMEFSELAYPAPARNAPPRHADLSHTASGGFSRENDDDYSGMRDYRLGDPPRHIAWKVLARTGEMLVTEYRGGAHDRIWIDWNAWPGLATEARLATLTRAVIDADRAGYRYGLRLPDSEIPPASGAAHRHACLRALALFGTIAGPPP